MKSKLFFDVSNSFENIDFYNIKFDVIKVDVFKEVKKVEVMKNARFDDFKIDVVTRRLLFIIM